MKLAFSTLGCPKWSLERIADFAAASGFDGVELRTSRDGVHLSEGAPVEEAVRIGELFRRRGTRIFSLKAYSQFGSAKPEELAANREILLHVIDLAKAVGANFIRTFAGAFRPAKSLDQAIADAGEALAPCAKKARGLGIALGVETHDDWCDAANIRALQEKVGGGLGAVWDFANAVEATGATAARQYAELGPSILYCHVKDAVRSADGKWRYVPVGTGEMPVREVARLLKADGRDLFLSFEHEKMWIPELPEPEEAFPAYIRFMRSLA
jgi:sugar phosphate isomerase/epimerase